MAGRDAARLRLVLDEAEGHSWNLTIGFRAIQHPNGCRLHIASSPNVVILRSSEEATRGTQAASQCFPNSAWVPRISLAADRRMTIVLGVGPPYPRVSWIAESFHGPPVWRAKVQSSVVWLGV